MQHIRFKKRNLTKCFSSNSSHFHHFAVHRIVIDSSYLLHTLLLITISFLYPRMSYFDSQSVMEIVLTLYPDVRTSVVRIFGCDVVRVVVVLR